jgi:hypothetical protein
LSSWTGFCIRYYLTNLRLIEERGIIGKRIMSIWLDKVQDVTCIRSAFWAGSLVLATLKSSLPEPMARSFLASLPSPQKLREEIEKAIWNLHRPLPGV